MNSPRMLPVVAEPHVPDGAPGLTLAPSITEEMLRARPSGLMVEYTSRCNLRCKYCPKSNPDDDVVPGRNMDMSSATVDMVLDFIGRNAFSEVLLAGTGESTVHPDWLEDFPRLAAKARAANARCFVHLNTNLALKYDDSAMQVLAMLDSMTISIDTADPAVTRQVRAKSDLPLIIYNMSRLRAYCRHRDLKVPTITVNVTLHEDACAGLPELMTLLADLPVAQVAISDMLETPGALRYGIKPVNDEDPVAFVKNMGFLEASIKRAVALRRFGLSVQPQLMQRLSELARRVDERARSATPTHAAEAAPATSQSTTRICLQPWTRFTVAADAALYPCCVTDMQPVGSLERSATGDGIDGASMRRFRHDLLVGNVPAPCVNCSNAPLGSTQELQNLVRALPAAP